jgi:signal transduction histidine kinase
VARRKDPQLFLFVLVGLVLGVIYVAFDKAAERRLASGTLIGGFANAHQLIDRSFPILAGGLLGLCLYQLRLTARLAAAEEAAGRAEALRMRLQKIERDQAVWVVIAAVLHELNNPLHALGLLLDEQSKETDSVRRADLDARARTQIGKALSRLGALRSLKTLGDPESQRLCLGTFVATLLEEMRTLGTPHGVHFELHSSGTVEAVADPTYLRTILENLLDNSLHSLAGEGGTVRVTLGSADEKALIHIGDDGPGLSPEIAATLFDPLRTTKTHGLGLGLPIARALSRAMRGELSLDGDRRFRLELPLGIR